jgi:hypothetical protein
MFHKSFVDHFADTPTDPPEIYGVEEQQKAWRGTKHRQIDEPKDSLTPRRWAILGKNYG